MKTRPSSYHRSIADQPTTNRRHLYLGQIQRCYLFRGAKQKLLDALLAAGRVELYMPQVEIVSEGEHVNDLNVLLQGSVEILNPRLTSSLAASGVADDLLLEGGATTHGGRRQLLQPGDCFSEVSFFTQIPNLEVCLIMRSFFRMRFR